ncbi:hypothetical protein HY406_00830 [Candidatus Giovannonibacteria bacterium]|nr:hypothetical protein [Candidatus Giovannonibacteria bacterium]
MNKKILVMHSEPALREIVALYLCQIGIANGSEIVQLQDGKIGEAFIKENLHELGLVIVYDMLPRMAGEDLARLTTNLAREEGLKIPVVLMTSRAFEENPAHRENLAKASHYVFELREITRKRLEEAVQGAIAACN